MISYHTFCGMFTSKMCPQKACNTVPWCDMMSTTGFYEASTSCSTHKWKVGYSPFLSQSLHNNKVITVKKLSSFTSSPHTPQILSPTKGMLSRIHVSLMGCDCGPIEIASWHQLGRNILLPPLESDNIFSLIWDFLRSLFIFTLYKLLFSTSYTILKKK